MAARSTDISHDGVFILDAGAEITASAAAAKVTLANAKTIRVIVLGAAGFDDGGTNRLLVTLGGKTLFFAAEDLDEDGVGIAHISGALCDADNNVQYTLGGTATVAGVFYELVDHASH